VNVREQPPDSAVSRHLGFHDQQRAAGPQDAPHLPQRGHPQVRRQVVHHQAVDDNVEVVGREVQCLGGADLEVAVATGAGLARGVRDHLARWIDPDDLAIRTDRPAEQPRPVIPLFASAGYEQTRMSDIAARVGVTEPVIFQNFGTKVELFAAALERATEHAVSHLTDLAIESAAVDDWLSCLLAPEHLDRLHTAPMFGVFFADAHRHQLDASIGGAMQRCVTRVAESIAGTLRRGQAAGTIRSDTSADALAWLVVSLIQAREFRRTHAAETSPALEDDLLVRVLDAFRPRDPNQDSGSEHTPGT